MTWLNIGIELGESRRRKCFQVPWAGSQISDALSSLLVSAGSQSISGYNSELETRRWDENQLFYYQSPTCIFTHLESTMYFSSHGQLQCMKIGPYVLQIFIIFLTTAITKHDGFELDKKCLSYLWKVQFLRRTTFW